MRSAINAKISKWTKKASKSLEYSSHYYWPTRQHKTGNALSEHNAVLHLAHAALKDGVAVYPQAARHGDGERGHLDLLMYDPAVRVQYRVEAKRLFSSDNARGLASDAGRACSFTLNVPDNEGTEILEPKATVVLLLGLTHFKKYEDFWIDLNKKKGGGWVDLARVLDGMTRGSVEFKTGFKDYYASLLYAWKII